MIAQNTGSRFVHYQLASMQQNKREGLVNVIEVAIIQTAECEDKVVLSRSQSLQLLRIHETLVTCCYTLACPVLCGWNT